MEQKSTSLWKSAMTYGLYMGIALILYSVILYVIGQSFNQTLSYVSFLLMIIGVIWAQISYRKSLDGLLTYGQGVGIAVTMMIFAGIIGAIYTILLYKVIDPELYDQYLMFYEEQVTSKLLDRGMSEAQIQQALDISLRLQHPVILGIAAIINYIIVGVVVSLITSIFIKKKPSEEIEE